MAFGPLAHLEPLKARLLPCLLDSNAAEPPRRRELASLVAGISPGLRWAGASFVVAMLAARALWSPDASPSEAPRLEAEALDPRRFALGPTSAPTPTDDATSTVVRIALTRELHALSSLRWNGRMLSTDPSAARLEMTRGHAVLAFWGGKGRLLTVIAPGVEVEVVGTQFFVRVLEDGSTAVGVLSGRVRVHPRLGSEIVDAGISRRYRLGAPPSDASDVARPPVDLSDPFIADHGHASEDGRLLEAREGTHPTEAPRPRGAESKARVRPAGASSPLGGAPAADVSSASEVATTERAGLVPSASEILARADVPARGGRVAEALALYDLALAHSENVPQPMGDLVRYERARLLTRATSAPWEQSEGETALETLRARATGEARVHAALTLSELTLRQSACAARACLSALAVDERWPEDVREEAKGLRVRWGREASSCGAEA